MSSGHHQWQQRAARRRRADAGLWAPDERILGSVSGSVSCSLGLDRSPIWAWWIGLRFGPGYGIAIL
jgi:hypothetical protein